MRVLMYKAFSDFDRDEVVAAAVGTKSHNGITYTVTEATTLTITNCPCTVTKPVYTSVVTSCSTWYKQHMCRQLCHSMNLGTVKEIHRYPH